MIHSEGDTTLEQGYVKGRLKLSLKKFYGRYGDLIKQYEVPLLRMLNDIDFCSLTKYNDNRSDFIPIRHLYTELYLLPTYERFQ